MKLNSSSRYPKYAHWGLAFAAIFGSCAVARGQQVLPFQARLSDASGKPVGDGVRVVQFQIYTEPGGGSVLWAGEIHRTTVNGGLANVVLGTKNPLPRDRADQPDRSFFDQPLYLQVTVDANADDQITAADPPLLPRQTILPVVFSGESSLSRNSQKLAGYDWSVVFGANSPNGGIPGSKIIPGTISVAQLSTNIQLNDPRTPSLVQGMIRTLPLVIDNQLNGALADGGIQITNDLNLLKALVGNLWTTDAYKKYRDLLDLVTSGIGKIPPAGMSFIPGGEFELGNSFLATGGSPDQLPVHKVTLSPFFMDRTEVTYALFLTNYQFALGLGYESINTDKVEDRSPVRSVSWYDAVRWCNARSQRENLNPVYYADPGYTVLYTNRTLQRISVHAKWTANGYRLPTEAEWERAARGVVPGREYPWGNIPAAKTLANYGSGTDFKQVAQYPTNDFGLWDMAGNVWEWCWDGYGEKYYSTLVSDSNAQGEPVLNPAGPSAFDRRIIRGGSAGSNPDDLTCARRNAYDPDVYLVYFGFRCVRSAVTP